MTKSASERKEMMISFIDATQKIIDDEGIENVTARKVAKLTGYNVSTSYKYFNNLNHIIFFASMKYYNNYIHDLPNYVSETYSSLRNYYEIWKCFSIHAFNEPKIFKSIFLEQYHPSIHHTMTQYYELFQDEFEKLPDLLSTMLDKDCVIDRDITILNYCVEDGYIKKDDVDELSRNILIFFEGLLIKVTNHVEGYDKETALKLLTTYVKNNLQYYSLRAKDLILPFSEF